MLLIDYKGVDVMQEENLVLKEVNFQAAPGDFIYIIGPVGSGKSSLLKTFYGELDVCTGQAKVLDFEMTKIKRRHIPKLRKQLGIVFQDFQLLNDRNVHANLDFVLKSTGWRDKKERDHRITQVLRQVGLEDKEQFMPYQLSGGEQQRICIARAILNNPSIILADEATGNLDKENGRKAASLLYDISKKGTIVVMSTHNEELIQEFPGIIYQCQDGALCNVSNIYFPSSTNEIESDSIESKSFEIESNSIESEQ